MPKSSFWLLAYLAFKEQKSKVLPVPVSSFDLNNVNDNKCLHYSRFKKEHISLLKAKFGLPDFIKLENGRLVHAITC
jgi:lipid-A-disaccharide synthase-like uncharacterized protein